MLDHYDRDESQQVWRYFRCAAQGIFVDVGANHPTEQNLTWFLEQQGWTGLLIEPNPEMAKLLQEQRPQSRTIPVAVGSPAQVGEVDFHLAGPQSTLQPDFDTVSTGVTRVPLRTLDSVLQESGLPRVDFLSLDVEGKELDVLAGFDLVKWNPQLILIEDFFYDHRKHACLCRRGYKLIKRTGYNNWYVPQDRPASLFSMNSPGELFFLARKMWFSGPIIGLRRKLRRAQKQP
jgi:FkbM family methyltransferase